MMISTTQTIGRPVLTISDAATGMKLELHIPQAAMVELIQCCTRDLLHNGSVDDATTVVQIARDIVDNF